MGSVQLTLLFILGGIWQASRHFLKIPRLVRLLYEHRRQGGFLFLFPLVEALELLNSKNRIIFIIYSVGSGESSKTITVFSKVVSIPQELALIVCDLQSLRYSYL